jgi:methylmalonyl-CoA carboxyltransferase 12S subunit
VSADLPADPTVAELLETVRALSERLAHLESVVKQQHQDAPVGVPDHVAIAISAAVAAFLGQRAKIKQMHYRTGASWAQQGRAVVQGRHDTQLPR